MDGLGDELVAVMAASGDRYEQVARLDAAAVAHAAAFRVFSYLSSITLILSSIHVIGSPRIESDPRGTTLLERRSGYRQENAGDSLPHSEDAQSSEQRREHPRIYGSRQDGDGHHWQRTYSLCTTWSGHVRASETRKVAFPFGTSRIPSSRENRYLV